MLLLAISALTVASGQQPQIDVKGDFVALAYGSGNAVYFARSGDGGRTFDAPVRVAETMAKLMLGKRRGPRIAVAGNAILITAVAGGDLLAWRSVDRGATWSGPTAVNSVPNAAREGLDGLSANRAGRVLATWLDLREGGTRLYGSVSNDGGSTWTGNFQIYASPDGHICECCHPSALVGADGGLHVMWRNWLAGSRDLWYAESRDDGRNWQALKLGSGTWPLNACPMDGGGLTLDGTGQLYTAWRRDDGVFVATPGQTERRLGAGKDPSLTSFDGRVYVAWIREGGLVVQEQKASSYTSIAPRATAPVLAGPLAAWEQDGKVMVLRLDALESSR